MRPGSRGFSSCRKNSFVSKRYPPPSFTPEFGPDGYMPTLPFTDQPVADLLTINTAMAQWLRRQPLDGDSDKLCS